MWLNVENASMHVALWTQVRYLSYIAFIICAPRVIHACTSSPINTQICGRVSQFIRSLRNGRFKEVNAGYPRLPWYAASTPAAATDDPLVAAMSSSILAMIAVQADEAGFHLIDRTRWKKLRNNLAGHFKRVSMPPQSLQEYLPLRAAPLQVPVRGICTPKAAKAGGESVMSRVRGSSGGPLAGQAGITAPVLPSSLSIVKRTIGRGFVFVSNTFEGEALDDPVPLSEYDVEERRCTICGSSRCFTGNDIMVAAAASTSAAGASGVSATEYTLKINVGTATEVAIEGHHAHNLGASAAQFDVHSLTMLQCTGCEVYAHGRCLGEPSHLHSLSAGSTFQCDVCAHDTAQSLVHEHVASDVDDAHLVQCNRNRTSIDFTAMTSNMQFPSVDTRQLQVQPKPSITHVCVLCAQPSLGLVMKRVANAPGEWAARTLAEVTAASAARAERVVAASASTVKAMSDETGTASASGAAAETAVSVTSTVPGEATAAAVARHAADQAVWMLSVAVAEAAQRAVARFSTTSQDINVSANSATASMQASAGVAYFAHAVCIASASYVRFEPQLQRTDNGFSFYARDAMYNADLRAVRIEPPSRAPALRRTGSKAVQPNDAAKAPQQIAADAALAVEAATVAAATAAACVHCGSPVGIDVGIRCGGSCCEAPLHASCALRSGRLVLTHYCFGGRADTDARFCGDATGNYGAGDRPLGSWSVDSPLPPPAYTDSMTGVHRFCFPLDATLLIRNDTVARTIVDALRTSTAVLPLSAAFDTTSLKGAFTLKAQARARLLPSFAEQPTVETVGTFAAQLESVPSRAAADALIAHTTLIPSRFSVRSRCGRSVACVHPVQPDAARISVGYGAGTVAGRVVPWWWRSCGHVAGGALEPGQDLQLEPCGTNPALSLGVDDTVVVDGATNTANGELHLVGVTDMAIRDAPLAPWISQVRDVVAKVKLLYAAPDGRGLNLALFGGGNGNEQLAKLPRLKVARSTASRTTVIDKALRAAVAAAVATRCVESSTSAASAAFWGVEQQAAIIALRTAFFQCLLPPMLVLMSTPVAAGNANSAIPCANTAAIQPPSETTNQIQVPVPVIESIATEATLMNTPSSTQMKYNTAHQLSAVVTMENSSATPQIRTRMKRGRSDTTTTHLIPSPTCSSSSSLPAPSIPSALSICAGNQTSISIEKAVTSSVPRMASDQRSASLVSNLAQISAQISRPAAPRTLDIHALVCRRSRSVKVPVLDSWKTPGSLVWARVKRTDVPWPAIILGQGKAGSNSTLCGVDAIRAAGYSSGMVRDASTTIAAMPTTGEEYLVVFFIGCISPVALAPSSLAAEYLPVKDSSQVKTLVDGVPSLARVAASTQLRAAIASAEWLRLRHAGATAQLRTCFNFRIGEDVIISWRRDGHPVRGIVTSVTDEPNPNLGDSTTSATFDDGSWCKDIYSSNDSGAAPASALDEPSYGRTLVIAASERDVTGMSVVETAAVWDAGPTSNFINIPRIVPADAEAAARLVAAKCGGIITALLCPRQQHTSARPRDDLHQTATTIAMESTTSIGRRRGWLMALTTAATSDSPPDLVSESRVSEILSTPDTSTCREGRSTVATPEQTPSFSTPLMSHHTAITRVAEQPKSLRRRVCPATSLPISAGVSHHSPLVRVPAALHFTPPRGRGGALYGCDADVPMEIYGRFVPGDLVQLNNDALDVGVVTSFQQLRTVSQRTGRASSKLPQRLRPHRLC